MSDKPSGPTRPTVYRSAVDLWLALLLLMTPATAVGFSVMLLRQGRAADALTLLLLGSGLLMVILLATVPCRYTILADSLSIRCGLIWYQIPLSEIQRVEESASLRSGPALSLRRVLVATEKRGYLLSPKDRDAFITDLNQAIHQAC